MNLLLALAAVSAFATPDVEAVDEPEPAAQFPRAEPDAEGLDVAFGDGVLLSQPGAPLELTFRARVQLRATGTHEGSAPDPLDLFFQVRRARLVFNGVVPERDLQFYIQLGVGPSDIEDDAPYPLRDWVLTWTRHPAAKLRMGQMKVPFTRERLNSSSALQLVDRSLVNAELNLDRDVGVQVFSNDLAGQGRLSYQAGVYNGSGRNRLNTDSGLLYAARVQVQPLGGFDDQLTQADLSRSRALRTSLGAAVAHNDRASRSRSTHGALLEARYDTSHASADLVVKWSGWSLQTEGTARWVRLVDPAPDGVSEAVPTDAMGGMVQLGRTFVRGTELAGRVSYLTALPDAERPQPTVRSVRVGGGRYLLQHDFKVQGDLGVALPGDSFDAALNAAVLEGRVQMQVYF